MRRYKTMPLRELINHALNSTLSRTTITSGLTLLSVLALAIFGGEVIRGFSIAMIWGIVIGTYSTICVATPLLLYVVGLQPHMVGVQQRLSLRHQRLQQCGLVLCRDGIEQRLAQ